MKKNNIKFFIIFFIGSLCNSHTMLPMFNLFGAPELKLDPEVAEAFVGAFAAKLEEEFDANGAGGRGMINMGQNVMHGLGNGLNDVFGQNGQGAQGIQNLGQQLQNNLGGLGADAINNAGQAFNNAFAPGGDGAQGIQGAGNEIRNLIGNVAGDVNNLVAQGGEIQQAFEHFGQDIEVHLGGALNNSLRRILITSAIGTIGIAGAWYGSKVLWQYVAYHLYRPHLLLDSSKSKQYKKDVAVPMVFTDDLQKRLDDTVKATQNIYAKIKKGRTNVKYRNLLLYGLPGTGKSMFAKRLAYNCGLEFAMMSGSSLSQYETHDAIMELDKLFRWAKKSKGLLLFIDEIDTLLCNRDTISPDSREYKILNHFLMLTGEQSNSFMIVGATNKIEFIDNAMERRFSDMIELPLPQKEQRIQVLQLYCDLILFNQKENPQKFIDCAQSLLTPEMINTMADQTDGLSNGNLQNIINAIQTDADITDDGFVTQEIINQAVKQSWQKHELFMQKQNDKRTETFACSNDDQLKMAVYQGA